MLKRLKKHEEGQVLIFVAVLMFVLIGFTALVVDVGFYYGEKRQLQNAVDAASLAGVVVADETNGDETKVGQEVDKYLLANLNKTADNRIIDIDMNEPITVAVDLTTDYPTFFGKIFQISTVDIYAHAKAILQEVSFETDPHTIMSQESYIEFNGNKQKIEGPIYSNVKSHPEIKSKHVTMIDSEGQGRSFDELIETQAKNGKQYLPDYSGVLNLPYKEMTLAEFKTEYFNSGKELSGIVRITGTGKMTLSGTLEGKGVVYYGGSEITLEINSNPDTSILYYAAKDIKVRKTSFRGTLYAPEGSVTFVGNPNNSGSGRILARDAVTFNGGKFEGDLDAAHDWMTDLPGGSKLIE